MAAFMMSLARDVAAELGPRWRVRHGTFADRSDARLIGPDEETLYFGMGAEYALRKRLVVHDLAAAGVEQGWESTPHIRITASPQRSPANIARDIERKFLDRYREKMCRADARQADIDANRSAWAQLVDTLDATLGSALHWFADNERVSIGSADLRDTDDVEAWLPQRSDMVRFTITVSRTDLAHPGHECDHVDRDPVTRAA